jgi:hypothetical protein
MLPLLEMACGKTELINEYPYLISYGLDQHPLAVLDEPQSGGKYVRSLEPYQCKKEGGQLN